jgi:hypothetical protein
MRRLLRSGLILSVAVTAACSWNSGPDCVQACNTAVGCGQLQATFYLSCSTLADDCVDAAAACASCIDASGVTCADLVAGQCDAVCLVPDAGP